MSSSVDQPISTDMSLFRTTLHKSRRIIVIAGAGLSAASGIPTFRGEGGLWRKFDAIKLATPEAFEDNPSRVWQFYHMRREIAAKAQSNPAHLALSRLFDPQTLASVAAPDRPHFALITQNIDGLSLRALQSLQPDPTAPLTTPTNLIEMHGRLFETRCTECGDVRLNYDSPICPALKGTDRVLAEGEPEPEVPLEELPRCGDCGGLLRPNVVWFGEMPLRMKEISKLARTADLALVVGTSSIVYPAAGLAGSVKRHGGRVAVFNLEETPGDKDADFLFLGPCEETLPRALFGEGEEAPEAKEV